MNLFLADSSRKQAIAMEQEGLTAFAIIYI
jgi:hypothetical protein